jgi:Sodium/hydrogen exchanger family
MEKSEKLLCVLASILVLGVGTHWLAWWEKIPAILLLLLAGRLAGPVFGLLDPEDVFGDLFLPMISLSVALILFEGGLNLRLRELRDIWRSLFGLLTVGVVVTWAGRTAAAILAEIKATRLTDTFNFEAFQSHYKERAYPLFLVDGERLVVVRAGSKIAPKPGQHIVSLILKDPLAEPVQSSPGSEAEAPLESGG